MTSQNLLLLANRIRTLYINLLGILRNEEEENWIRGVKASINLLDLSDSMPEENLVGRLRDVLSIYKTMNAGYGSFTDFFIWHEDDEQRAKANRLLGTLRKELWEAISELRLKI